MKLTSPQHQSAKLPLDPSRFLQRGSMQNTQPKHAPSRTITITIAITIPIPITITITPSKSNECSGPMIVHFGVGLVGC